MSDTPLGCCCFFFGVLWLHLRLFRYTDRLRAWLDSVPDVVQPPNRAAEVRQFLDEGLPDLSVSRLAKSLSWGIPVPGDPDHTVYVRLGIASCHSSPIATTHSNQSLATTP